MRWLSSEILLIRDRQRVKRYYVYALCWPGGEPFYVGKSTNKRGRKRWSRVRSHLRHAKRGSHRNEYTQSAIVATLSRGHPILVRILRETNDEDEAYAYEARAIRVLRDTYGYTLSNGWPGL